MPDFPAEAVDAVIEDRARRWGYAEMNPDALALWKRGQAEDPNLHADLAAALPHLRARWLAEVQGALDFNEFLRWHWENRNDNDYLDPQQFAWVADYLRDVLGAGAGGEDE